MNYTLGCRTRFFILIGLAILVSLIPVVNVPLSWNLTFFHEISHGIAALVTGGSITRIAIHVDGSGVCYSRGGSAFLILFFGYTGAVVWGGLLYLSVTLVSRPWSHWIVYLMMVLIVTSLVLWARDLTTVLILIVLLAFNAAILRFGAQVGMHNAVQFVGIYVLLDAIKSPLHLFGADRGDAKQLEDISYLPEFVWIFVWLGLGVIGLIVLYNVTDSVDGRP